VKSSTNHVLSHHVQLNALFILQQVHASSTTMTAFNVVFSLPQVELCLLLSHCTSLYKASHYASWPSYLSVSRVVGQEVAEHVFFFGSDSCPRVCYVPSLTPSLVAVFAENTSLSSNTYAFLPSL
jgi:hypothetical protein